MSILSEGWGEDFLAPHENEKSCPEAEKQPAERSSGHLLENRSYPELPQDKLDLEQNKCIFYGTRIIGEIPLKILEILMRGENL